jgi:hypothetical protein
VKVRVVGTVLFISVSLYIGDEVEGDMYAGDSLLPSVEIPENPLKFPSCVITSSRLESFRPWVFPWEGAKRAVIGDDILVLFLLLRL